jgi:hypothetical protein
MLGQTGRALAPRSTSSRPNTGDKLRSSIACAGFVCFIPLFDGPDTPYAYRTSTITETVRHTDTGLPLTTVVLYRQVRMVCRKARSIST